MTGPLTTLQEYRLSNGGHSALAPMRSIKTKGSYGKHIIRSYVANGRRYELHATKGWRSYRA